jgi:nitrite reductase (NADH) small subunit
MNDTRWIGITDCGNIPAREGRAAIVGDREIAIFNLGTRFLAVDNRCPHKGGPLADGIVTGGAVVCPLHAWKFSLHSGAAERSGDSSACVRTYPTRVEAGIVLVQIPSEAAADSGQAA